MLWIPSDPWIDLEDGEAVSGKRLSDLEYDRDMFRQDAEMLWIPSNPWIALENDGAVRNKNCLGLNYD